MMNRLITSVLCVTSMLVVTLEAGAADPAAFAGVKSCRMCHKKEATGNQYGQWVAGPHSKTFAVLGTAEAKAVAATLGIPDAQKSGKCLKCHATSYNLTEAPATKKITAPEGVTCESCHGPGKKYKSKKVMVDRAQCIAYGMFYPATQSCTTCHNDQSPTWKSDRYTDKDGKKVGFDVKKAYEKIKHPNPAK
jgi:hypothetical protein